LNESAGFESLLGGELLVSIRAAIGYLEWQRPGSQPLSVALCHTGIEVLPKRGRKS
jgi:hypothetical protein